MGLFLWSGECFAPVLDFGEYLGVLFWHVIRVKVEVSFRVSCFGEDVCCEAVQHVIISVILFHLAVIYGKLAWKLAWKRWMKIIKIELH